MKTFVLILIIVLSNSLTAKDILLNTTDSSLTQNIRLDSINFVNNSLGVDVTIENPKKLNFEDVVKIASSVKRIDDEFNILKHQNKIIISGEQLINKIQVYDILGKEIFSNSYNSKEVEFVLNSNEMYNFIYIYTNKGVYFNKIMNLENVNYVGPKITNSEDNWDLTFYSTGCKTKSLSVNESQLGDTLDLIFDAQIININIKMNEFPTFFERKYQEPPLYKELEESSGNSTESSSGSGNFLYVKSKTRELGVTCDKNYKIDSTTDNTNYVFKNKFDKYSNMKVFINENLEIYGFAFVVWNDPCDGTYNGQRYSNETFLLLKFNPKIEFNEFINSNEVTLDLDIKLTAFKYYYISDFYQSGTGGLNTINYIEKYSIGSPKSITLTLTKVN